MNDLASKPQGERGRVIALVAAVWLLLFVGWAVDVESRFSALIVFPFGFTGLFGALHPSPGTTQLILLAYWPMLLAFQVLAVWRRSVALACLPYLIVLGSLGGFFFCEMPTYMIWR